MEDLERDIFERSVSTLLNEENGVLVLDNELIASKVEDVENKSLSNRKTGKESSVADCVSCCLLVLYVEQDYV